MNGKKLKHSVPPVVEYSPELLSQAEIILNNLWYNSRVGEALKSAIYVYCNSKIKSLPKAEIQTFENAVDNSVFVNYVDVWGNFTSVELGLLFSIKIKKSVTVIDLNHRKWIGYSKRNPNFDHYDMERGLTTAISRAMKRLTVELTKKMS